MTLNDTLLFYSVASVINLNIWFNVRVNSSGVIVLTLTIVALAGRRFTHFADRASERNIAKQV